MFEIDNTYLRQSSLPVITDNYKVLHFDEYPILFSGTNRFGNKLLGSLAYEDVDNDVFRYFVIIVDDKQNSSFFNKSVSYLQLIKESQEMFIIDKDINDKVLAMYNVPLDIVPPDYLPLQNSFIPAKNVVSKSLSFSFSLKGKLADMHKALVNDVNSVNNRIYSYLNESIETLRNLGLEPQVFSQPSEVGSYKLNFDVEFGFEKQLRMFPINPDIIGHFLNNYLQYVSQVLPSENDEFLSNLPEQSKNFQNLQKSLIGVYETANVKPSAALSDMLVDSINISANKLSEVTEYLKISQSFNAIEIGNYDDNGDFLSIGYLDSNYKSSVSSKLLAEEKEVSTNDIIADESPQNYRILVYKLNIDTGNGGARIYEDNTEKFTKIKLTISKGDKDLSFSVFTKSLNEDIVVDVKGIAIKINGTIKELKCYL
ncbi:hypothetical protein [Rubrolithibacter danxiaensis]|uniref:hypothetical protein n=1 Tax=Rubrolithibacter danxiaensis TaxID=3390805 RepID=UPI003BF8383B